MPLLDHFHPPVDDLVPWESLHSSWATRLADALNEHWLPGQFLAVEHAHVGSRVEVDVASFERQGDGPVASNNGGSVATLPRTWAPPAPQCTVPAVFLDTFEVRVYAGRGGWTLVGAVELVNPGNKDRPEERRAFATKCASYLHQGVSLVVIDIVTDRRANLHNEVLGLLNRADEARLPDDVSLYAAAYRPVLRGDQPQIDVWTKGVAIGEPLPTMPLRLTGDLFVPVEFEAAYLETCRRRRVL
jgi:hypothetical protein